MKRLSSALFFFMAFVAFPIKLLAAGEIVIGQVAPLTGVLSETGRDMMLGGRIYFDYVNSQGGINGKKIKHVVLDDGYKIDQTVLLTKYLIEKENAVVLFGYAGTGNVSRLLEDNILAQSEIALVGPYTGGETLREPYNPYLFHVRASYNDETAAMVRYFQNAGISRVGVLYQDDAFGLAGLKGVTTALATYHLQPVITAKYAKNTVDVTNAVAQIAEADPQAVVLISVNKSSAAFIKEYKALSKSPLMFNVSVVNPAVLIQIVGIENIRGIGITQVVPDPVSSVIPAVQEYQVILKKFGEGAAPSYTSFEEFLAAKVVVEGLKRAGGNLSRANVVAALESITNFDLGGYQINFGSGNRRGSAFVETVVISKDGKTIH